MDKCYCVLCQTGIPSASTNAPQLEQNAAYEIIGDAPGPLKNCKIIRCTDGASFCGHSEWTVPERALQQIG